MSSLLVLALAIVTAPMIAAQGDAAAAAPAAGAPPNLMQPLPPDSETSIASALMLPRDVAVVRVAAAAGGGSTPNALRTRINHAVLMSNPTAMSLTLPGVSRPIQVNKVATQVSVADVASQQQQQQQQPRMSEDDVWVGEVAGQQPAMSVVTMLTEDSNVYGTVRYFDAQRKAFRSFRVLPAPGSSAPATYRRSADNTTAASAAALAQQQDNQDYVVVEFHEPTRRRTFLLPPTAGLSTAAAAAAAGHQNPEDTAVTAAVDTTPVADSPASTTATKAPVLDQGGGRRKLQQATVVQDILVVYTQAAANKAGGDAAIKAAARDTVARTNKAYADSGVNVRQNLLDARLVIYNEFSRNASSQVLDDLSNNRIPNVNAWRDQLGADLVALFQQLPDVCGIAWVAGGAGYAFSTVNNGCWNGYTHAHETGHNQGCYHNIEESPSAGYKNGWRRCDLGNPGFKTILSYNCPNSSMTTNEVAIFATPDRVTTSNQVPVGDATKGNCARAIAESAAAVANYRTAPTTPVTTPVPPPATTPVPPPPTTSTNPWAVTAAASPGLCVYAPNFNNGQQVSLLPCDGSNNQRLERQPDGSLRFAGTTKCLDASGLKTSTGTAVQVWDCSSSAAQIWSRDEFAGLRPRSAPQQLLGGTKRELCAGALLQIWGCNRTPAQQMKASFISVVPRNSISSGNLCINAPSWTNGARATLLPCSGSSSQRYALQTDGSLRWLGTNKCLDVNGGSSADGTAVQVWDCNGSPGQHWARDSSDALRTSTGKCLDVPAGTIAQGAQMQVYTCNGTPSQRFRLDFIPRTLRARPAAAGRNSTSLPLLTQEQAAAQAPTDVSSPALVPVSAAGDPAAAVLVSAAADPAAAVPVSAAADPAAASTAAAAAAEKVPSEVMAGSEAGARSAGEAAAAAASPPLTPPPSP